MIDRKDFPMLSAQVNGQPLVYFDNAATSERPLAVIKAADDYYLEYNANVHRGLNPLADMATERYEGARTLIADFIGAQPEEVVFTSGTTASINLVARSWGEVSLKAGDTVLLSIAEHHANIVPWLQLKEKIGINILYIPLLADGQLDLVAASELLNDQSIKLLAVSCVSNVLGIINPVKELISLARNRGITTLVDAAQAIAHYPISVKDLDCDFLVFSGHKMLGPTGIGVLYGRRSILETMPPFLGGGGMISSVHTDHFTPSALPHKLEAGTPNISGAIALGAACLYLQTTGWELIEKQERELSTYFLERLSALKRAKLLGTHKQRVPVFSLALEGLHPHDAADLLGQEGIIVRAGHHCAQPLHDYLEVSSSLRASLSFYNTVPEIDRFIMKLEALLESFS
jgi:cysteine desulfurase/selenocysteine lyase